MSAKEKPNCPICLSHFTPVIRQPITCSFCPNATCRQCTSQYLLTTQDDPHCMQCKREWNREFIDTKLTQTFRKGPLKLHRRKILMERERGRLPAMQVFVEAQTTINSNTDQIILLRAERRRLKQERNKIQVEMANEAFDQIAKRLEPIHKRLAEAKTLIRTLDAQIWRARAILTGEEKPEAREFIMKCPAEECRGFLSSAWKCGTCQKFFCSDCHAQKESARDESHVCNPDAKATASMIRKETKPCPKCGIRISKIDGCDQMWCTECHTTFSWNSGQILLNTVVHNPHYYEYLRRTNGGAIPREAGDVPCGGLPNGYLFNQMVARIPGNHPELNRQIMNIHRGLSDILYVRLPNYPLRAPANMNRDLDLNYLMRNITEEEWGTKLEQTETRFERKKEIGLILQTFVHVGSEKLTMLQNATTPQEKQKMLGPIVKEMEEVRDYINNALLKKGVQMGMIVPQLDSNFFHTWSTRDQMKQEKTNKGNLVQEYDEDNEEEAPNQPNLTNEIVQAPPTPSANENDIIQVDIGGELIEMTRAQWQEMMH